MRLSPFAILPRVPQRLGIPLDKVMEDVDLGPEEHGQLADEAEKQGNREEAAYHSRMQFLKQKAADRFNKPDSEEPEGKPPVEEEIPRGPACPGRNRGSEPGTVTPPPQPPKIAPNAALGLPEKAFTTRPVDPNDPNGGYEVLGADEKPIGRAEDAETAQHLAEAHKQDWQEQPHEKAFQVFKQDNAGPNGEPLYTVHGRNGEEIARFHDQKQADRWASIHRNAWLKKVQAANEAAQQQATAPTAAEAGREAAASDQYPRTAGQVAAAIPEHGSARCSDCPFCTAPVSTPLPRA